MLSFAGQRIYLVIGVTDMRKSFGGLSGIASSLLGATPSSRDFFVFSNRARNRLKILYYDESGAWVFAKRLDKGTFAWPDADVGESVEYMSEELTLLLGGLEASDLRSRNWHRREAPTSQPLAQPMQVAASTIPPIQT